MTTPTADHLTSAAGRYASALFQTLSSRGESLDTAANFLRGAAEAVALQGGITPLNRRALEKATAAAAEKGGASPAVRHFISLLISKGRIALLPDVAAAFDVVLKAHKGIVEAVVRTAAPLSESQKEHISAFVRKRAPQAKDVTLNEQVVPALKAGFVVRVGAVAYDASLKGRLEMLRQKLVSVPHA